MNRRIFRLERKKKNETFSLPRIFLVGWIKRCILKWPKRSMWAFLIYLNHVVVGVDTKPNVYVSLSLSRAPPHRRRSRPYSLFTTSGSFRDQPWILNSKKFPFPSLLSFRSIELYLYNIFSGLVSILDQFHWWPLCYSLWSISGFGGSYFHYMFIWDLLNSQIIGDF